MDTNANSWSARDRSREESGDYYQKTPLVGPMTGYNDGSVTADVYSYASQGGKVDGQSSATYQTIKNDTSYTTQEDNSRDSTNPRGIKSEDSMEGYLTKENPAHQADKNK